MNGNGRVGNRSEGTDRSHRCVFPVDEKERERKREGVTARGIFSNNVMRVRKEGLGQVIVCKMHIHG